MKIKFLFKIKHIFIISLLLLPLSMHDVFAAKCSDPSCQDANACGEPGLCSVNNDGATFCTGSGASCVPEMSDYLAMAFVVVAGGMLYFIRKRSHSATA